MFSMVGAPFCGFFPLIPFYGHFDLPQYRLAALAHRRTQLGEGVRGVEVEYVQKVLMGKIVLRFQPTPGHEDVSHADGGGTSELRSDAELIILPQETAVNDVEDVLLMLVPIFRRKLGRDLFQLLRQTAVSGRRVKSLLQRRRHRPGVFLPIFPQPGTGLRLAARVIHIEHIPQKRLAAAVVDDGDTHSAPPHIPAHLVLPGVVLGAGGGVGPLGMDQELLRERIFLKMLSRGNVRFELYSLIFH